MKKVVVFLIAVFTCLSVFASTDDADKMIESTPKQFPEQEVNEMQNMLFRVKVIFSDGNQHSYHIIVHSNGSVYETNGSEISFPGDGYSGHSVTIDGNDISEYVCIMPLTYGNFVYTVLYKRTNIHV